jgi:hypothetical protein
VILHANGGVSCQSRVKRRYTYWSCNTWGGRGCSLWSRRERDGGSVSAQESKLALSSRAVLCKDIISALPGWRELYLGPGVSCLSLVGTRCCCTHKARRICDILRHNDTVYWATSPNSPGNDIGSRSWSSSIYRCQQVAPRTISDAFKGSTNICFSSSDSGRPT